jgi:hypothetical protein
MGVKDTGILGAEAFADFALNLDDLVAGFVESLFEPLKFLRDFLLFDLAAGEGIIGCAEDKDFTATHPCRYRYATVNLFSARREIGHERLVAAIARVEK